MLNFNFNVPKKLKNIEGEFKADLQLSLFNATNLIEGKAKVNAPYKSGTLRRSITSRVDIRKLTGEVGTNVIYGPIQEYGGIIKPKKKKYLTFKIGNKWIRTRKVKIKGKKYLSRALKDSRLEINNSFKKILQDYK